MNHARTIRAPMHTATVLQTAVIAIMVGVMIVLLGAFGWELSPDKVYFREATAEESRRHQQELDRQQLLEAMDAARRRNGEQPSHPDRGGAALVR